VNQTIAIADRLDPARREELAAVLAEAEQAELVSGEIDSLREQLDALWTIMAEARRNVASTGLTP
jgi:hypothetical protein